MKESELKLRKSEIDRFKQDVIRMRVDYAEDILSLAQDNAPKDTGALSGHVATAHNDKESEVGFVEEYAKYIEYGTRPFNAKLITIQLSNKSVEKLGRAVRRDKVTGEILAPVWWEWADKKARKTDEVERYKFCWSVYNKIAREGITAQHFFQNAVLAMERSSALEQHFPGFEVNLR